MCRRQKKRRRRRNKKKELYAQKIEENAGAGENADPAERAPSGTRLLDDAGGAEDFSHPDTYNRYEKGIREIPLDSLMLLAKTYDCSLDYLAGVSDRPRKYGR